nr:hypothetical protein [Klebsiella pneumoniae]
MEHLDTSKMEEKMGLTFTTIYRGDNKNNGTQHEPLSEESLGMFQGHDRRNVRDVYGVGGRISRPESAGRH